MIYRIVYERDTCGRCGGSGRYSYNPRDGDRCFGCAGKGTTTTRRGEAARDAVRDMIRTVAGVRADAIRVGDLIRMDNGRGRRVTDVGPYGDGVNVRITYPDVGPFGGDPQPTGHIMPADDIVVRAPTEVEWARIVAFARGLAGVTIEERLDNVVSPAQDAS